MESGQVYFEGRQFGRGRFRLSTFGNPIHHRCFFFQAEAFAWEGTLSQEAITILAQHAVQGKLTGADTAMARWLVFAYTHHDLPLDYQVSQILIFKRLYLSKILTFNSHFNSR